MALQPLGNQRNYLQHIAQIVAQNPAVLNGAAQIGRFAGQQIREAYHNWQREYNRPRELQEYEGGEEHGDNKRLKDEMASNDTNMETGQVTASYSGYSGNNGGPRGSLVGNTESDPSYEKYYHEKQMGHSKKLKQLQLTWGISKYGPRNRLSGAQFPLLKWGTAGVGGQAVPGVCCIKSTDIYGNTTINAFTPYGNNQIHCDFSENVYSNAINFYLQDFVDNKLMNDSATKGFFLNYNKFRLLSFTIEITPYGRTESMLQYAPNVFNSGRGSNGWQSLLNADEKALFINYKHPWYEENDLPGYFIYRDIYNSYAETGGTIKTIPSSAQPEGNEDVMKREQYVIKNLDHNLTFVKDRESFSFTRTIKAQGNYYFDRKGILDNMKTPIGNIVNQLEGQIVDGSNIVKKNPEGFNLLIVPGRVKVEMFGEINLGGPNGGTTNGNGYLLIPALTTELLVKTTAKWEAFDYNYIDNQFVGFVSDPLEKAIFDYNVEKTITQAQLNRGIV